MFSIKRDLNIDFLRFVAVLLVVVRHSDTLSNQNITGQVFNFIRRGGWIGVDLFFIISGFLISVLILKEIKNTGKFNLFRFLIRRGFKIYPIYYLFIICQYLLSPILGYSQSKLGLVSEALFIANYVTLNNIHLWSLCVEEHFYFFISIVLFNASKIKINICNVLLFLYSASFIIAICFKAYNYINFYSFDFERDFIKTHLRIDGLFLGSLIGYVHLNKNYLVRRFSTNRMLLFSVILISCVFLITNFVYELFEFKIIALINTSINPICLGIIFIAFINLPQLKLLRLFSYVGKYSYSIYIFHVFFLNIKYPFIPDYGLVLFLTKYIFVFVGGIFISRIIEYPILNLRDRILPSPIIYK